MSIPQAVVYMFEQMSPYSWVVLGYWVGVIHVVVWQWLRDWDQRERLA